LNNLLSKVVQIPIGKEKNFTGVIDLINMRKLIWNKTSSKDEAGRLFQTMPLDKNDDLYEIAQKTRISQIEKLAQISDEFAEILLEKYNMNYDQMNDNILFETHLRKSNLKCLITPVLCGSSFKNIGVQPLMDAICKYLPNPDELAKNNFSKYYDKNLYAVCFKIIHDHNKLRNRVDNSTASIELTQKALNKVKIDSKNFDENMLTFVRIYNGELSSKTRLFNPNKKVVESCEKIFIPYSNQIKRVSKVTNGNIALISGLQKVLNY
jgi:elongation factor G